MIHLLFSNGTRPLVHVTTSGLPSKISLLKFTYYIKFSIVFLPPDSFTLNTLLLFFHTFVFLSESQFVFSIVISKK